MGLFLNFLNLRPYHVDILMTSGASIYEPICERLLQHHLNLSSGTIWGDCQWQNLHIT